VRPDEEEEGRWCASSPSMASAVEGWSGWWCLVLGLRAVVRAQTGRSDEVGPCVIGRRGAPSRGIFCLRSPSCLAQLIGVFLGCNHIAVPQVDGVNY
jgi:hypothetical protein